MKLFKILIIILSLNCSAQEVFLYQDGKLMLQGDERGNNAGTFDLIGGAGFSLLNNKSIETGIQLEWANLVGGTYLRTSTFVGYTQHNLFIDKLNTSLSINYGAIRRYEKTYPSFGSTFEVSYLLVKRLRFVILTQYTQRTELKRIYRTNDYHRISLFGGLKFNLNKN